MWWFLNTCRASTRCSAACAFRARGPRRAAAVPRCATLQPSSVPPSIDPALLQMVAQTSSSRETEMTRALRPSTMWTSPLSRSSSGMHIIVSKKWGMGGTSMNVNGWRNFPRENQKIQQQMRRGWSWRKLFCRRILVCTPRSFRKLQDIFSFFSRD